MHCLVAARRILNARPLSTSSPGIQVPTAASELLENIPHHSGPDVFTESSKDARFSGIRTLPKAQSLGDILIPAQYTKQSILVPSPEKTRTNWEYVRTQNRPSAFASVLANRKIDKVPSLNDLSASLRRPGARDTNLPQLTNGGNLRATETGLRANNGSNVAARRYQQDVRGEMRQTSVKAGFDQRRRDGNSHEGNGGQRLEARGVRSQRTDRSMLRKDGRQPPRNDYSSAHRAKSSNLNTRGQNKGSPASGRFPILPLTAELQQTNLTELFGSIPSPAALRAQSTLEHAGGDYSRYLPEGLKGCSESLSPLKHARLVLSRSRDVGLQGRNRIMKIVKSAVGTSSEVSTGVQ